MRMFDSSVIEQCTEHLERRAGSRVTGLTLLGGLVGASRAAGLRLQAQLAQHQLHLERLLQRLEPAQPAAPVPTAVPLAVVPQELGWPTPPALSYASSASRSDA